MPAVLLLSRLLYSILRTFPISTKLLMCLAEAQSQKKLKSGHSFQHITTLPTEVLFLDAVALIEQDIAGFPLSVCEFGNVQK